MSPSPPPPFPFVVGVSRSGTTLLRLMLDAHPDMAIPPESYFITGLYRFRTRYELAGDRFDYPRFAKELSGIDRFAEWDLPRDRLRAAFAQVGPGRFADAMRLLYRTYAEVAGKPRYGDKTPGYLARIQILAGVFPEARFVHIVRDPRAVALSHSSMPWGAKDVVEGAVRWRHYVTRGREQGRALGAGRYTEVRYEDLVADPEPHLRRVAEFLDLPYDPAMLEYPGRAMERVPASEQWQHQNLSRPPTAGVRDWRAQLSDLDLATVEAVIGPLMEELGYERSVADPPAEARRRAEQAERDWATYQRRRKRRGRLRKRLASLRPGWRSPRRGLEDPAEARASVEEGSERI